MKKIKLKLGLSREIDEILEELNVQIPKIEVSDNESINEDRKEEKIEFIEEEKPKVDYSKIIEKYKKDISSNSRRYLK